MLSHFETIDTSSKGKSWCTAPSAGNSLPPSSRAWITDLNQMKAIEPDWRRLEARSTDSLVYFQSFDWCYKWCQGFIANDGSGSGPQIRIFTFRKNGQIEMIWPLMLVTRRFGIKELVFIGEPLTQYGNILLNPQLITDHDIRTCWQDIFATSDADLAALNNYPAQSALKICRQTGGTAGNVTATSIMDLSRFGSFADFVSSLKKSTRRNRNKRRNKLASLGSLEQVVYRGGTDAYASAVQQALAWKQTWLKETGRKSDILQQQRTSDFLQALTDRAYVFSLQLDGKPIAIEIGFLDGTHYYSYLGAFDWRYANYSPGKIQMEETFRWAIENNVRAYDLLGNPSTYKSDWSNVDLALASHLQPLTAKGSVYARAWTNFVKPRLKRGFYWLSVDHRKRLLTIVSGLRRMAGKPAKSTSHSQ